MGSLEYIDEFFSGSQPPDQKKQFEERVASDAAFAAEVAFYISTKQAAIEKSAEEKKEHFRQLYLETSFEKKIIPLKRKLLLMAVAASIITIAGFLYFSSGPQSYQEMADSYIREHFGTLGVQMSGNKSDLQAGLTKYNQGRYEEALESFEAATQADANDFMAKKYAGIVCLELDKYDKALGYFMQLEQQPGMYANPGKFYHALTLMQRGLPQDKPMIKQLLQQVVSLNLEGKETAVQWLKEL